MARARPVHATQRSAALSCTSRPLSRFILLSLLGLLGFVLVPREYRPRVALDLFLAARDLAHLARGANDRPHGRSAPEEEARDLDPRPGPEPAVEPAADEERERNGQNDLDADRPGPVRELLEVPFHRAVFVVWPFRGDVQRKSPP